MPQSSPTPQYTIFAAFLVRRVPSFTLVAILLALAIPAESPGQAEDSKPLPLPIQTIVKEIDETIATRIEAFAARESIPNITEETKARIRHMSDLDQYIRRQFSRVNSLPEGQRKVLRKEISTRARRIDAENARTLRHLLEVEGGWFTNSKYGSQVAIEAFTLIQHADNHPELQIQVLGMMRPLAEKGEASPSLVAYLHDRVCYNQGTPQRYGTQGGCNNSGAWEPHEIEDPESVDARRAEVGLPPLADYIRGLQALCQ